MKLTEEQWAEAKGLYVAGQMSYRDLAGHYGVALSTVYKRGKDESWGALREDVSEETTTKKMLVFSEEAKKRTKQIADIYGRLVNVLDAESRALEQRIEDGGSVMTKALNDYIYALKTLKEIGNIKTEQELREQDARLRLLEKQIAESTDSGGVAVTVSFEGVDGCEV